VSAAVAITGVGVVTPLGDALGALHEALCRGERAVSPIERFAADGLASALGAEIAGFDPARYLGEGRNYRPLDRNGRLTAAAAELALADGGWDEAGRARAAVGLVLGTMFGSVHTISEFDVRALKAGPNYVKPLDFANSVINAPAGQSAIWHGLRGVNTTIAGGPAAGLQALAYAADRIAAGRAETVLAGGSDELCFESFLGFARAGRTAGASGRQARPVPFDARRDGFALGEGATLLVLESAEGARRRGARILGALAGHGAAFDPSRRRDPASAARAVERAVLAALADAGLAAADLAFASLSADGSVDGDVAEARGVAAALGAAAYALPVTAVKSMLGEPLGAGGALQAAAALATFGDGRLPGIAGLEETDPEVPLGGVAAATREVRRGPALLTALDFDGNAFAVVLVPGEGPKG